MYLRGCQWLPPEFLDAIDDVSPEVDGVLELLAVSVLRDSLVAVVVFLQDEGDRYVICGVELRFVFEESVAFAEADVVDSDELGLVSTGYFRVLAGATGKEKYAVDEFGNGKGNFIFLFEDIS